MIEEQTFGIVELDGVHEEERDVFVEPPGEPSTAMI